MEIYKSLVNKDEDVKGYGTILESGQLKPRFVKELIDNYDVYCICLGHGDLDKQGIIDLCRENDKEKDWSYGISDEDLDAHAEKWAETNENLKVECPKYGIEYIDTHINREETLNKIMEKIEKNGIKMNRLLRISFDTLLTSLTPILGWFLLGILVDENLINIFSLIYPIQFIISAIKSVFGTGANVSRIRDNNKNSVYSGILIGSIVGAVILGIIVVNIDKYISFMNMDIDTYKIFGTYGVIQMFLQLLLNLSLCKLYFEDENKRANKYSFLFNIINFSSLILLSIITKEQIIIAGFTTIISSIFVIVMLFRLVKRTKIQINILNCIKYDAVELFHEISMFIIYLFGFKTAFNFGEKYILAISFSDLITDTQWDIAYSIKILAQIDITKKVFSYKEHIKNSRKLIYLLITSVLIMGTVIYPFYKTDIPVTLIITGIGLIYLYMYPVYVTKMTYLQMEYSAMKATISKQVANLIRIICSFLPTPFCTTIGLMLSVIYQLLSTNYYITKNKLNMEMKEERKAKT